MLEFFGLPPPHIRFKFNRPQGGGEAFDGESCCHPLSCLDCQSYSPSCCFAIHGSTFSRSSSDLGDYSWDYDLRAHPAACCQQCTLGTPKSPHESSQPIRGNISQVYLLWMSYFIKYWTWLHYFFVSVFKFVFPFILLCWSLLSVWMLFFNIIAQYNQFIFSERQAPPHISVKFPPPLDVQQNSPSSGLMDWMTISILGFFLLCLLFGICLCIFLKKCGMLGNRCPLCRNWLSLSAVSPRVYF